MLAAVVLPALVGFLIVSRQGRAAEQPPADKAKLAETNKVELNRLSNEELLKQAGAIYEKASRDYLANLRGLATAEKLLEDVRKQTDEVKESDAPQTSGDDPAMKAVEAARAKQDAAKRKLKLVQTQKELLDRITTGLEECRSGATAFQNVLDDLKAYALEAALRAKDGSLAEDRVPAELRPGFREKKLAELADDLGRVKAKTAEVRRGQEAVAKLLEDATKAAAAADADVVEASKNQAREQQRQELEKGYTGKKQDEMIAELARMVEEGIGLKGTYELALRKFQARANGAVKLRNELEALKPPDVKVPQLTRAEDVETAAKAIQELIEFYTARTKRIEKLRSDLATLVKEGGEFEADAAVSEEHLFKMQVLANLLKKNGVPDAELPEKARAAELDPAAVRQKESAASVRATTEKAKSEIVLLDRQRTETQAAEEAAAKQLANLKGSQDVTLAALKWEGQLKDMTSAQVVEAFIAGRKELTDRLEKLKGEAEAYNKAAATVAEATARLDGLKDPFLRAAEEQGQGEKQKLLDELRKEAGLDRAKKEAAPAPPPADPKKADPEVKPPPDKRTELEKTTDRLLAFQQLLAGRVRVQDEREVKTKELLAAIDELEKAAGVYTRGLAEARLLALKLSETGVDLKKRLGKGEIQGDTLPEGITDALRLELRTQFDASATSVLNALNRLQQDREMLRRPDPDGEALKAATKDLLTVVGKRLDLLADIKRLDADLHRDKSARPPSEVKRLEQLAAERQSSEASRWDTLLKFDASKSAKSLSDLLETYYRELIDIEEMEENLKKQRDKANELVELTQKETDAVVRMRPLLAKELLRLEEAREEETVLARARLRPDQAEELLKTFQTKTGRLLGKPLPLADKEKTEKVEALGNLIFERYVMVEAAKKWDGVLSERAGAAGAKAEAGVYQDEITKMNAASSANVRRVHTLTGQEQSGPATGGEIAKTRAELARIRTEGVKWIGIKIGCIILGAVLVPWVLIWILRRVTGGAGGENSSLVLSAIRALLKAAVWVTAFAMILSVLGFDVTAIIAGLGIGGLAIGLAAQPMIADVIAAMVIVAERRFTTGNVIRIGNDEPAQVVGLTWRSTQVKNADGLLLNIPNRKVTEASIQNLTRPAGTYDSLNISVTTQKDANKVLDAIRQALTECKSLSNDHGVSVKEYNHKGETKTIKYRFWWFLNDYEVRNKVRDEIFARIGASLANEDLAGTEISLA
jgi:small-conductance mechanosensitive channel